MRALVVASFQFSAGELKCRGPGAFKFGSSEFCAVTGKGARPEKSAQISYAKPRKARKKLIVPLNSTLADQCGNHKWPDKLGVTFKNMNKYAAIVIAIAFSAHVSSARPIFSRHKRPYPSHHRRAGFIIPPRSGSRHRIQRTRRLECDYYKCLPGWRSFGVPKLEACGLV